MEANRTELNKTEKKLVIALAAVTFMPASYDKRFYCNMSVNGLYTDKQKNYLHFIFNKYRKQIRNYEELAMELDPDRFKVEIDFKDDLFNDVDIKITDTFNPQRLVTPIKK